MTRTYAEQLDGLVGPQLQYEIWRIRRIFQERGYFATEVSSRVFQEELGSLFNVGRDPWMLERKIGVVAAALEIEPAFVRLKVRACWPKPPAGGAPLKVLYEDVSERQVNRIIAMIGFMNTPEVHKGLLDAIGEFLPPPSPKHWMPERKT